MRDAAKADQPSRKRGKVARWMAQLRRENEELRKDRDMPGQERMSVIVENNRQIRWLARDFMKDYERAARAASLA